MRLAQAYNALLIREEDYNIFIIRKSLRFICEGNSNVHASRIRTDNNPKIIAFLIGWRCNGQSLIHIGSKPSLPENHNKIVYKNIKIYVL